MSSKRRFYHCAVCDKSSTIASEIQCGHGMSALLCSEEPDHFDLGDKVELRDHLLAPQVAHVGGGLLIGDGVVIEFRGDGWNRESFVWTDCPALVRQVGKWINDRYLKLR